MTPQTELKALKKRREAAAYQRKIVTTSIDAIEYDNEIAAIDRRIELLGYEIKKLNKLKQ